MADAHEMMIAVDDSSPSRKAVAYVADLIGGTDRFQVHLLHVLPPIPPSLLEHGGRSDPDEQRQVEEELTLETAAWRAEREREAAPLMNSMRDVLETGGVRAEDIRIIYTAPLPGESVTRQILAKALKLGCRTVVVGRALRRWWQEVFHSHPSGALVRAPTRGVTVWVVE